MEKLPLPNEGESKIDSFHKKAIRKVMHDNEWWFSVKDILEALTDTTDGSRYSYDLRTKDAGLKQSWAEITRTLNFDSGSGGKQDTAFISVEGIFRVMQSVPSPKAEPFKKWLARVAFERLQEIQNPELAIQRAITLYRAKGYDDGWIDARIRNKASREALTAEWDKRKMIEYCGILTDAISVETFGIGTQDHKKIKGLTNQNLRDNMTPIELTLTTLGEQATTEIIKVINPITLEQNKNAAKRGGRVAGAARMQIEQETHQKVVSPANYLTTQQIENNSRKNSEFDNIMRRLLPGRDQRRNA
jgi:prophage antirepressor-like protein